MGGKKERKEANSQLFLSHPTTLPIVQPTGEKHVLATDQVIAMTVPGSHGRAQRGGSLSDE